MITMAHIFIAVAFEKYIHGKRGFRVLLDELPDPEQAIPPSEFQFSTR